MYTASTRPANHDLISPTWIVDSLRIVRDLLQDEGREHLAAALSIAIGGLAPNPDRYIGDGGPDFELLAIDPDDLDPIEWPAWTADQTPLSVSAAGFELPRVSGGTPFVPTEADWQDFADATDDDGGWYREVDARAAGLAI